MAVWASRCGRIIRQLGRTGCWLAVVAVGCTQQEPDQSKTPVLPAVVAATPNTPPADPRLHQPFLEAVLLEPPEGQDQLRPPDQTKAGKNVAKLYEAVVGKDGVGGLWDQVKFVSPAGKRLAYTATIDTELGKITIELWPDVAPNHVRNFVALARAGYYDGLEFDRTVNEKIGDAKDDFLEYLEAGCPLGTADPNYGSIGYWLKPELNEQVKHEAGTIGAWHAEEVETAACKFYITLDKAPWMDGNWTIFGKITQGLDVARAIRARPVRADEKDRPVHPVVMRAVTIASKEVEAAAAAGQAP
jgi:peptidyl-prolyl cis-trans isomerase B (cyclophilin B)